MNSFNNVELNRQGQIGAFGQYGPDGQRNSVVTPGYNEENLVYDLSGKLVQDRTKFFNEQQIKRNAVNFVDDDQKQYYEKIRTMNLVDEVDYKGQFDVDYRLIENQRQTGYIKEYEAPRRLGNLELDVPEIPS